MSYEEKIGYCPDCGGWLDYLYGIIYCDTCEYKVYADNGERIYDY